MPKLEDFVVGEHWLHRPSIAKPGVEVKILGVRPGPPPRVQISFAHHIAPSTVWVPPSQLKSRWADKDAFLDAEDAWRTLSSEPDELEWQAVVDVFEVLVGDAVNVNWNKSKRGTLTIVDADRVNLAVAGELQLLVEGAQSIDDSTGVSYGWRTAVALARRAAELQPDRVLRHVRAIEAEAQRLEETHRRAAADGGYARTGPNELAFHKEFMRPLAALLRAWCGEGADDAELLRQSHEEISRLNGILIDAVVRLATVRDENSSWALYARAFPDASRSQWRAEISHGRTGQ